MKKILSLLLGILLLLTSIKISFASEGTDLNNETKYGMALDYIENQDYPGSISIDGIFVYRHLEDYIFTVLYSGGELVKKKINGEKKLMSHFADYDNNFRISWYSESERMSSGENYVQYRIDGKRILEVDFIKIFLFDVIYGEDGDKNIGCYLELENINLKLAPTLSEIINTYDSSEDKTIISDLNSWSHPTKEVLIQNDLIITRVELTKNNTYPIFIVKSISNFTLTYNGFLYDMAKENGYWDFAITDGSRFVKVYCDKRNRIIYKVVSNEKTIDINNTAFSDYNGIWYDVSLANLDKTFSKMEIRFNNNSNEANLVLSSSSPKYGNAQINAITQFDCWNNSRVSYIDANGNQVRLIASLYDNKCISTHFISPPIINNVTNLFVNGFGRYVKEYDYINVKKSMALLSEKYSFEDQHQGNFIPKTEDDSVYFVFEGKTEDGRYRIAVRRCRDTYCENWYLINPYTKEIEIE